MLYYEKKKRVRCTKEAENLENTNEYTNKKYKKENQIFESTKSNL